MPCDQLCHEITVPPSFCCLISPLLSLLICEIHLITLVNFTEVSWSLIKFWKGCQEPLAECSEEVSRWEMDTREGNVLHRVWVSRMGWSCPLTGTVTLSGHCHELWGHPCWGATSTNIHFPLSWDLRVCYLHSIPKQLIWRGGCPPQCCAWERRTHSFISSLSLGKAKWQRIPLYYFFPFFFELFKPILD